MKPLDRRLLPLLAAARGPVLAVLGAQVTGAILVVAQAFAITGLVVDVIDGEPWGAPATYVVVVLALRAVCGAVVDVAAAAAADRVGEHVRKAVLRAVLDLPATTLAARRRGELTLLATRGSAAVSTYVTRYLPALVLAAVLPVVVLAAIVIQDRWAALVVVLTLPLVPVFAALVGMATRDRVDRQWRVLSLLAGHFVDVVRGLPTLVTHRRARAQRDRIAEVTDRYRRANRDVLRLAFASSAVLELVATVAVALVAVLVGLRLAAGGLPLGTALVVLLLAPEAYWPPRRAGAEFHAAAEGTAALRSLHDLQAAVPPAAGAPRPDRVPSGALRLDAVRVCWPGRDRDAVGPVSALLPQRGLVALTGPSGCGKSTLLAALAGEVAFSRGHVSIGEQDLDDVPAAVWRRHVAVLPQRPWLLDGTVADNVRLGRPAATDEGVLAALRTVDLALPLDHQVGEDGAALSAGQRARLALARVVVGDRPVVLLDEPTAHLDTDTETAVLQVVRRLSCSRLVVAVAHSRALVETADTVLPLSFPTDPTFPTHPADPADARVPGHSATDVATPAAAATPATSPAPGAPVRVLALATLLGILASASGVALTATAGWLIARSADHPPVLTLMVAIVGVRTFGLARPVLRWCERVLSHDAALRTLARRRARVYDDLVDLVPGRLGRRRGDLLASVVDDVDAVVDEQVRVRQPVWAWLGTTTVVALAVAPVLPAAGAVVLALGLLGGIGAWSFAAAGGRRHGRAHVAARAEVSRRVQQVVDDARPLVQWQAEETALQRVALAGARMGRATRSGAAWTAVAHAWPLAATGVGLVALAATVATAPGLSGPEAALLLLVPLALTEVVAPVADAGALRHHTRAARGRLDALRRVAPAVADPVRPAPLPTPSDVSLRAITASWHPPATDGAERRDLPPTCLEVAPGRAVGVIGPSGCGKSTLAAVLVRHLSPTAGEHDIGGVDVRRLRADDVRSKVGLLDDDPYLFATSVLENVRLARPDATDTEVDAAIRAAQLGTWVDALPDRARTIVGDGGAEVSGGERARLGLARLLLGGHDVLVLDEPTAHLDTATARAVTVDLLALRDDAEHPRALVWITHDDHGLDAVDEVLDLGAQAPASTLHPARHDRQKRKAAPLFFTAM